MKDSVVLGFLTSVAMELPEYEEIVTDLLLIYQSATKPAPTIAVLKSDKNIIWTEKFQILRKNFVKYTEVE